MTGFARVGVVGAGAWGTALALVAHRAGAAVTLWARRAEVAAEIARTRSNAALLPGVTLDAGIEATADPAGLAGTEALLLAVPAQHLRSVSLALAPHLPPAVPLVLCAKGIERSSLRLMTEVAAETLPDHPLAVLSGPTFAAEVARGLPTAVTLAAADADLAGRLIETLGGPTFRPYLSDDPVGAQIGGAVKNVLAIACGIVVGRRLGDNARAALLTRGLAEILRLGAALGARHATLMGLSGLGDLALTCTSTQSRNLSVGMALGEGTPLAAILAGRRSVAEGVDSAAAVSELAGRHGVEMPIVAAVARILNHGADIDAVINELLSRPFRAEGR